MATSFNLGVFPVGSAISRATARALIEERRTQSRRAELVICKEGLSAPWFGDWQENSDGSFTRRSSIPNGMTFEEAEIAAGLSPVRTEGDYMRIIIPDRIRTQHHVRENAAPAETQERWRRT